MPDSRSTQQLQDAIGDRYALERELGRGGMGVVWLARDLRLDRPVAIKVLHERFASDPTARERFIAEARTAARLAHPNIVPVFAVESRDDITFLAMAMVDGETLGARIRRRGPLPSADVERLLREVGWALGYAHSQRVVHRDITPENILVERGTGRALLADFGLARIADGEAVGTIGTPGYLAPEVIRGAPATPASDIYALGATAWFALAGVPPFSGDTAGELLAKHLVQPLPDVPLAAKAASRRLIDLLRSCLEKDPEARPVDVAALLARLDRSPPQVSLAPPLVEWFTRWERVRVGYAIATPVLALQLLVLMETYLDRGGSGFRLAAAISWILNVLVVPIAVQSAAEFAALRKLASQGYGIGDIRSAWDHWTAGLKATYRRDELPPLAGRVIFDLTVVGAVTIFAGFLFAATVMPYLVPATEWTYAAFALMSLGSWLFLGTAAGASINLVSPGVRLNPDGFFRRLAKRFWRGPLAGLLARTATTGVASARVASNTIHRNTELVLGLAIETLWQAIPAADRSAHGDVPALAATLQHGAEEMRTLANDLADAQSLLPVGHPEAARLAQVAAEVSRHHREAVARLESLRLHLLRAVSLATVTTDLAQEIVAAREAERLLLFELAGANEARLAIGKAARSESLGSLATPTPSPVMP